MPNRTLETLRAFAYRTGDLASVRVTAKADPGITGHEALKFLLEYENSSWTVGEARERAGRLVERLEAQG